MADVLKILSDIKGKALDAVNFELLKRTYELQNKNIEQLKNNNEALKESINLLKEKDIPPINKNEEKSILNNKQSTQFGYDIPSALVIFEHGSFKNN